MKNNQIIPLAHKERIEEVLNLSWKIFKSQFINNKNEILKEAPFQFHFAQIINEVGSLYSLQENDFFRVHLEKKELNLKGKSKYIDITCEFIEEIKCAIELKFKTAKQGAQDHGRIDAYIDLEALELLTLDKYDLGKFYMITDSKTYVNKSVRGVGTVFSTHDGYSSEKNKEMWYNSKGRENVKITLKNSYEFLWEKINDWYFLEITVKHFNSNKERFTINSTEGLSITSE